MKSIPRIGLSLLLIGSGLSLLYNERLQASLPEHFERLSKILIVMKYLVPYARAYYHITAVFMVAAGIFGILNQPMAQSFYGIAAVMFCIVYDNPMLARNDQERYLRYIYMGCHLCVFFCLSLFADEVQAEARRMQKAQNASASQTKEAAGATEPTLGGSKAKAKSK